MNQNLFIVNESFVLFQLKTNRNEKKTTTTTITCNSRVCGFMNGDGCGCLSLFICSMCVQLTLDACAVSETKSVLSFCCFGDRIH